MSEYIWETIDYIGKGYVLQKKMEVSMGNAKNPNEAIVQGANPVVDAEEKQKAIKGPHGDMVMSSYEDPEPIHRIEHIKNLNVENLEVLREEMADNE